MKTVLIAEHKDWWRSLYYDEVEMQKEIDKISIFVTRIITDTDLEKLKAYSLEKVNKIIDWVLDEWKLLINLD